MNKNIFLGGGGDEIASQKLDSKFMEEIKKKKIKRILYIPLASSPNKYPAAEKWFKSIFSKTNCEIVTITELDNINLDPALDAIYIGGGDTVKLLLHMQQKKFDKKLINYVNKGGIIYGGSAGAIILGKDIRTAPETHNYTLKNYAGLNILNGYSIMCHYGQNIKEDEIIQAKVKTPIIALYERSGVHFLGNHTTFLGPYFLFN